MSLIEDVAPSASSVWENANKGRFFFFFFEKPQNVPFSVGSHAFINNRVPFKTSPLDKMDNTFLLSYSLPQTHTHAHTHAVYRTDSDVL